jgi:hypothetical protein
MFKNSIYTFPKTLREGPLTLPVKKEALLSIK